MLSGHPFARGLVDLVREVIARYSRLGASQFAAAISYRALFSLVPLATFVATILARGALGRRHRTGRTSSRRSPTSSTSPRRGPPGSTRLIAAVPSPWSLAGLVALGLALWGATGVMSSVLKTLAVVFDDGVARSFVRGRLVSALARARCARADPLRGDRLDARERRQQGERERRARLSAGSRSGSGSLLGVVVPLALTLLVFLLLYRYLPHHRPGWRAAILGGGRRRDRLPGGADRPRLVPLGAGRLHQGLRLGERDLRVPLLGLPRRERVRDLRDPHGECSTEPGRSRQLAAG